MSVENLVEIELSNEEISMLLSSLIQQNLQYQEDNRVYESIIDELQEENTHLLEETRQLKNAKDKRKEEKNIKYGNSIFKRTQPYGI